MNKFDTTKNPEKYVIQKHSNTWSVLSPADLTEGACYAREVICTTFKESNAVLIMRFLNGNYHDIS